MKKGMKRRKKKGKEVRKGFIPVLRACRSHRHAHRGALLAAAASLSQQLFCVFPHCDWPKRAVDQIYFDAWLRPGRIPLATVPVRASLLAERAGCQGFGASFTILRL